jgi:predicted membrane-bound spermidine synthase
MNRNERQLLFLFFFVSGFCGLVYQVVWMRLAFASFGIITPVLSVVVSVFMLGLSLGSWAGGRWINRAVERTGWPPILFYGIAEFIIGVGAFTVPVLFRLGEHGLLGLGDSSSGAYLATSALVLGAAIIPWCISMGATFPLMMAHVRQRNPESSASFSFLYTANVLGALAGTLLTALVLVELLGFRHTLWVAAAGNFGIAGASLWLAGRGRAQQSGRRNPVGSPNPASSAKRSSALSVDSPGRKKVIFILLFATGFVSMAMEVVWTRAFTPILKTQVYSFALILAAYLAATFFGSLVYRKHLRSGKAWPVGPLVALLCIAGLLPVLANDPRLLVANWQGPPDPKSMAFLLFSLAPFCGLLGYLTPGLIDRYGAGAPGAAGKAYAVNVAGCILGPLLACYALLPNLSEKSALLLLTLPLAALALLLSREIALKQRVAFGSAALVAAATAIFLSLSFEDSIVRVDGNTRIRRDYAASVVAYGKNMDKHLLVNGIGMTTLTPITKFMVHLPMSFHQEPPKSALIICFGMGTSFRSALSWGVETTCVELVPSVARSFGYYHEDAAQCSADPKGRVVVDDGRRFLKRTRQMYDIIVIDPPPPPEAAGSSLLYSEEFYAEALQHLKPDGILQAWIPGGDRPAAVARSVRNSFPFVRCFNSVQHWGTHFLASRQPIPVLDREQLAKRFSPRAEQDLLEWTGQSLPSYLDEVLSQEFPIETALDGRPTVRITDDCPYNEYFFLRQADFF